jgi:eukaryotic-like serine/threonine-protein kinase
MHRQRVESLFEAALELEPGRRHDFVAAACGDDAEMRDAVLRLLSGHARAGVLDVDPAEMTKSERTPDRLGPYRVHREIGRGGMGTVYDAERDDGQFRRRVAIKIIRGADPELQRRFLAERQILAALDHPNIARLLDGGVAPDGSPYIVMEHVEGLPVDVYCDRMRLTTAERLRLFAEIARAVEFAHRNLIVHCDLKPSNILVTPDGRAKLLDFGVAKLLSPWLAADSGVPQQRGMTLAYASPEQLRGEALVTSSDVYSLGVLLYELMTGRRPHQQHEHAPAAHAAAVLDGALIPPSLRVQNSEDLAAAGGRSRSIDPAVVARARQASVRGLVRELAGDIDAITVTALRTEPPRRYGSAELLAQDIDRHLTHRPVRAHSGGRVYALGRLIRRHRLQAVALAVAFAAFAAGAGGALWQARVAEQERSRAEEAMLRSNQVADFLLGLFQAGEQPVQGVLTGRDLVRRGAQQIDQLEGQPDVQARLLGALGAIQESLGEYADGQDATERALRLIGDRTAQDSIERARLLVQLGTLMRRRGEYDSAQALFFRARDIQERVAPLDPALGRTLQSLVGIAIYLGDFAESERRAREAVTTLTERLGENHRATVNMLTQLGAVQRSRGDRAGAEQTLRSAIQRRTRSTGSTRHEILNDRFQLASLILGDTSRSAEAEALFRAELPLLRADVPDDLFFVTWAEGALADLLWRRGDADGAEARRRHILSLRLGVLGPDHPATAEAMLLLGNLLVRRGRLDEGENLVREGAVMYGRSVGERHPTYAAALVDHAEALGRQDRLAAADSVLILAAAIRRERYGSENHGYVDVLIRRGVLQTRLAQYATAESLLNQALQHATDLPSTRRRAHAALADLYTALNRPADAANQRRLAAPP